MSYFEALSGLANQCNDIGLTIFQHEYDERVWGSWLLIIGTEKRRMKYCRDGKESYLTTEHSQFNDLNSEPEWKYLPTNLMGTSDQEVFSYIWDSLNDIFNT